LADRFYLHIDSYFRFITTSGIEPTNNLAEQAIRFVAIHRRLTQGTRSEAGQTWCERIWTALLSLGLWAAVVITAGTPESRCVQIAAKHGFAVLFGDRRDRLAVAVRRTFSLLPRPSSAVRCAVDSLSSAAGGRNGNRCRSCARQHRVA
jgi:hypothetical protein